MIKLADIRVLHLEPTTVCNAACPQCSRYLDDGSYNSRLPPGSLTVSCIAQQLPPEFIGQLDKMFMCGTFGEPAAAHQCMEIFRHFREINSGITLGMNTNGSLKSAAWWAELASTVLNQSLDYVVFSIDGLEDTNHIYRQKTQWNKIIQNAKAFIDHGGSAHWDMLVFEHNKHQVDQARALAKELGFKWFRTKSTNRFDTRPISWLRPAAHSLEPAKMSQEIVCKTRRDKEVYFSAHGLMLPCCYVAEELYAPNVEIRREDLMHWIGDLHEYSLSTNSLPDVIDKFSRISDTWLDNPVKLCVQKCSTVTQRPIWQTQWTTEEQLQ